MPICAQVPQQVKVSPASLPNGLGLTDAFVTQARSTYQLPEYQSYTNSLTSTPAFHKFTLRADVPTAQGLVRWVDVGGTVNFRDIGGWNGLKTGRVWRGAEPNCHPVEAVKKGRYHDLSLTDEGKRTLAQLKIRTDLDLRGAKESPTPNETPVPNAQLLRIPCGAYTDFLRATNVAARLLRVFANPTNYPIYFHCWGGADRTGSLAFVLEGLCGVGEIDVCIDYELTSFSRVGQRARFNKPYHYAAMVQAMKRRPGKTLPEKIAWWVHHECGLTYAEIAAIRRQLGADACQAYAEAQFHDYVARITNGRQEIALTFAQDPTIRWDGFRLRVKDGEVHIAASRARGFLYGVYDFLSRFGGVRWYSSWMEKVPHCARIALPDYDKLDEPAFEMREAYWFDLMDNPAFAARMRTNARSWLESFSEYGGNDFRFGGGLSSCHTLGALVPAGKYFKVHPEYFAWHKGKRVADQLCLSHPDVFKIVLEGVLARIRKDPHARFYGISQNDNVQYCQCEACTAVDRVEESHAGTYLRFVNRVAEEVEKHFQHVTIETLAYQFTRKPPKFTKPRANVVPCFCSIECSFATPLADAHNKTNVAFMEDLRAWGKVARELYVWDYTTAFGCHLYPMANVHVLQPNLQLFRDAGVKYMFEQGAHNGYHADMAELKAYLLSKWMWNPDIPLQELLDDFLPGYYGAAAPFVREYLMKRHEVQKAWADRTGGNVGCFADYTHPSYSNDFLREMAKLWARAQEAVRGNPVFAYNVRMGALAVDYTLLMRESDIFASFDASHGASGKAAEKCARAQSVKARLTENPKRVIWLCEHDWNAHLKMFEQVSRLVDVCRNRHVAERRVEIPASVMTLYGTGKWAALVDDPEAEAGKAVKLFNDNCQWNASLELAHVAFQPGKRYRLSVRVKAEAEGVGEAFWVGVYNTPEKKTVLSRSVLAAALKGKGYHWYDVGAYVPQKGDGFWIAPGRFTPPQKSVLKAGAWFDALAITECLD